MATREISRISASSFDVVRTESIKKTCSGGEEMGGPIGESAGAAVLTGELEALGNFSSNRQMVT